MHATGGISISTDDIYRAAVFAGAGAAAFFSRRNHKQLDEIHIVVNGRTDRMQKRIEELTALLVANGINVPELETSSAEPPDAQQRLRDN